MAYPSTRFRVPQSHQKGLLDTLIAAMSFGYRILSCWQPPGGIEQPVPENVRFCASRLVIHAIAGLM